MISRANNAANTYMDSFNQFNNVYFQDPSGNNLSNGIQWADADLRYSVYQDHFPNTMNQQSNMFVYVPLIACHDPVKANEKGIMTGYDVLPKNAQLLVNSTATSTQQNDIVAYVYGHIRVEGGKVRKF